MSAYQEAYEKVTDALETIETNGISELSKVDKTYARKLAVLCAEYLATYEEEKAIAEQDEEDNGDKDDDDEDTNDFEE